MIYIGNLILRTMVPEYFNNSLYFKSYGRFFRRKTHILPWYKDRSKHFLGRLSRSKTQVYGPQNLCSLLDRQI